MNQAFTFDGTYLPERIGVVNRTGQDHVVRYGREDCADRYVLPPGYGFILTLDGPRIVEPGDRLIPRFDGTWRVEKAQKFDITTLNERP